MYRDGVGFVGANAKKRLLLDIQRLKIQIIQRLKHFLLDFRDFPFRHDVTHLVPLSPANLGRKYTLEFLLDGNVWYSLVEFRASCGFII